LKKHFTVIVVLLLLVSISGCVFWEGSNKNVSNAVFENQWVKFQYPSNLKVQDSSNDTFCSISLYEASYLVGNINFQVNDKNKILSIYPDAAKVTIAGKEAIIGNDETQLFAYVFLNDNTSKNLELVMDFNNAYESAFNITKNSLEIKKVPLL
jgi:hypothetical protein